MIYQEVTITGLSVVLVLMTAFRSGLLKEKAFSIVQNAFVLYSGEASDSSDDDDVNDDVSDLEQEKPVGLVPKPVSESEKPVEMSEEDESGFDSSEMDTENEENGRHQ